jgi:hypothetical protein
MAGFSKTQLLPALHVCMSMQALSDVFGDRIIRSGIWPARSPYLNPRDFFFLDCLKDKFYNSNPRTEKELKENIRREITNIRAEQLQRANQNLLHRCEECLRVEGQHFQHLLWCVNCNYFISNVIGQQPYWFSGKICMLFAAGCAPVAVKRRAVNWPAKVSTSLYIHKSERW